MRKYKGALYNIGPIEGDDYAGCHTYSQVLFPFLNKCWAEDIEFEWCGDGLKNSIENSYINNLVLSGKIAKPVINKPLVRAKRCSVDLLDPNDFDFLFLQPRPKDNFIESTTVDYLIKKFTDAKKRVFLYEQDMFPINPKWVQNKFTTHLKPYLGDSDLKWKDSRTFLFWHSTYRSSLPYLATSERLWDFLYLGNVYGRRKSFKDFLGDLQIEKNAIVGNWMSTDEKKEFSSQFKSLNFYGSTNHNLTIPLMNAAKFTLQILPEWAMSKGLFTARVFNAVSARTLCFVDDRIFGSEQLFPKELIVKNGKEMQDRIKYFKDNPKEYCRVMSERDKMMEPHSVEKRVDEFKCMLKELI